MSLDVPRPVWSESVEFWSRTTRWEASTTPAQAGRFVTLVPPAGDPWLQMQAIPDSAARVHLVLDTANRGHGVKGPEASPGGLLLLEHAVDARKRRADRSDPGGVLDQVCIDIAPARWDEELAFWQNVTGRELERGLRPEFAFLGDPDPHGGLRVLLQRLDSGDGVSAHPDFAVADRPAETGRHEALGAITVRTTPWWTVVRAPDGLTYCLTDRDPTTGRVRR